MKKLILIITLSIVILSGLFSCKKIIASLFNGLEFNIPDMTVLVPAVPYVSSGEQQFGTITQHINLDSVVKSSTANQFAADVVKHIVIKTVTINITNADDLNNLSNFESARITLSSNTNSTPINIASVNFPNTNSSTFTYNPTDNTELVEYLKGSTLTLTLYGKNRKITTKALNFVASVRLKVN